MQVLSSFNVLRIEQTPRSPPPVLCPPCSDDGKGKEVRVKKRMEEKKEQKKKKKERDRRMRERDEGQGEKIHGRVQSVGSFQSVRIASSSARARDDDESVARL